MMKAIDAHGFAFRQEHATHDDQHLQGCPVAKWLDSATLACLWTASRASSSAFKFANLKVMVICPKTRRLTISHQLFLACYAGPKQPEANMTDCPASYTP